ncbi:PAS domain S-box protein [Sphingoaurantiacus capsulatus]|uniref:histidine kinase n=1 Tax=Sphingoaurantiacus capsulatus TaxID=1771310 RepID=A0ABV7X9P7_9SPHN
MATDGGLIGGERDLAARVARLEQELAEAKAALAQKPIVDRAQLFALTDSMPVLVSVLSLDHHYEFANKAYESWFGPEDGKVIGRHAREVLGDEAYAQLVPPFERAAKGERVTFESDIPYKSGGTRHAHVTFAPRRNPADEITGVVAMAVDLTGRFVDEVALRESEDHYRHAVELNPQTSWTAGADGQLDHVNSRWEEWTGTSGLGSGYLDGLHPDDQARTLAAWQASTTTGQPYDIEHRVAMRDGSFRWMHSRGYPRRNEAAAIVKWYGTTEDIHDRKAAEQALAGEAAERNAILGQLAEGVIVTDAEGRITFVNDAAARIHGMARLHVGAGDYAQTYRLFTEEGEPYPSAELPLSRAVRGETVSEARWLIRRPDAEVLAVGSARPVLDDKGAQIGAVLTLRDESAREMAEAMVRHSEARYRSLFESIDAGFCVFEMKFEGDKAVDYRFIEVNPAFERLTGLHNAEGRWMRDLVPEHEQYWFDVYGQVARTGEPVRVENHAAALGYWYDIQAYPVGEPGDNRVAALFNDVSDRKLAEAATHAETEALETLNRFGAAVAAELDVERVVQLVTDAGVELTGAQFGAFFYNVLADSGEAMMLYTLSGAERAAFEKFPMPRPTAVFRPSFEGEGIVRADDILVDPRYGQNAPLKGMPEGHLPVRSYIAVPVASRSGEVIGSLLFGHPEPGRFAERHERVLTGLAAQAAVAIDNARLYQSLERELDERRRAEAAVRESEARFRLIADSAPIPMWVTRLDRQREFANSAYVGFLELPYEEALAFDWRHIIHPDDIARIYAEQVAKEAALEPFTLEARYRNAKGEYRWIRSESQPRWGANGEHAGFIGVAYDVTIAKQGELELQSLVEERTAELRQAQKMEAVGQLTGGIAHDFNNLLTPIMGSLDMLRRRLGPDDVRAQRTVETALQATERAATLVQRLLAFARRQDLQARAVDVAELLTGMDDLLARSLGGTVRVSIEAPDGLAPARVDPNQLELAILNLSINARDAMPGGGALTLTAREGEVTAAEADLKPGRYVRIAVADTGVGMDAETLRRAVEPFFSTKGVGKGTGLGLSMVYGFAAQQGGALRLSSAPGVGTIAELWLPVSDEAAAAGASGRATPRKAGREATILLVDDEELVRAGTTDMLTDLGYTVVEARAGAEALSLFDERDDIDLVVSDYLMPDMNGAELASALRERKPALPILLVTGYTNLAEGVAADLPRLAKPFRQDDLAVQVAALLKS